MNTYPEVTQEEFLRELSAIYRSDLTLLVSSAELSLLSDRYQVPRFLLELAPFYYNLEKGLEFPSYEQRKHFIMLGNFRHPPNADGVKVAATNVVPTSD